MPKFIMSLVDTVIAAAVAAVTSVAVTVLSLILTGRQRRQGVERSQRRGVEARFLNPLRLQAALVHIRLTDVLERAESGGPRQRALQVLADSAEVPGRDSSWFTSEGCYLTSTVYMTACLFSWIDRVSRNHPFLQLRQSTDAELTSRMINVQRAFLRDYGIYFVLQPTIGHEMWLQSESGR